ncbi:LysR substrate-binding domain-containing protein [Nisaea denitrificans]|uniref:LysR substrate-binding domain-containing protein n=1 Tax=Nisaea denitrificans TaxID=390877 RepID=UPI0006878881|nr:LysR substrate-binding domain-containing protein [Nisaea denitrificans]
MFDIFLRLNISLRQLHQFAVVARELHFGRAAAQLHMTQPPLSMAIQSLETSLGIRLFERTNRQVSLTEAGTAFLTEVEQIAEKLDLAVNRARKVSAGEEGEIRLGVLPSCSVLPEVLRTVRKERPGLAIDLREATTAEQLALIQDRRIDAGLIRPPVTYPEDLEHLVVATQPLVAALPDDHHLSKLPAIPIDAFRQERFIGTPTDNANGLHGRISALTAASEFEPNIVQVVREIPTVMALVAGGLGVSIIPKSGLETGYSGVTIRPIEMPAGAPAPEIALWLAWSRHNGREPLHGFLEALRPTLT